MLSHGLVADIVKERATECGLQIVQSLVLPARKPQYSVIPSRLHTTVIARLERDYPSGLYRHQAMAIEALLDGHDVALSTSTASGKSLVFITAAMDIIAKEPTAKVLALYPAKALIRDQIDKWESATRGTSVSVGFIDGSVPTERRYEILRTSKVVLMTPDVAHAWFMCSLRERHIAQFRAALRLLILDEAHVYEGVFGTNMAYLMRRLDCAAGGYRLLCSTATLGRPSDFVHQLTGRRPVSIGHEEDGSAAPPRQVFLARDPGYDKLVELLKVLATIEGSRFLAFSDSRKMVEQIVAATMRVDAPSNTDAAEAEAEDEGNDSAIHSDVNSHRILPFRAGYEADDAKEIQSALFRGTLGGVVSTSAMELGLDIGEIDLVVMLGIPPSLKAFWQRLGRAGRRRDGVCLVIDTKGALTGTADGLQKYISKPLEPSWLYLDNRYLQYANVLCAALEITELGNTSANQPVFETLPAGFKKLLENELNPTEVVPADLYPLKQRAQAGPHREFPLRSGIEKDFKVRTPQGISLGNVTFSQMLREAYPGAVYYYMARPYRVVRMDLRDGFLSVKRSKFWTTRPIANTMVFPRFNGGVLSLYGTADAFLVESELQVSERVLGFQESRGRTKLDPHKYGPNSEWFRRELMRFFETTGVCWYFPGRLGVSEEVGLRIIQAFCLAFGVQEREIGFGLFHAKQNPFGGNAQTQGLCIYDAVDGSLRLTQRLAENFTDVVKTAAEFAAADGLGGVAAQLWALHKACSAMAPVTVAGGRTIEPISTPDNWVQVVASGEKAVYLSPDGPREVTVSGYRFTPKGLLYELVPENDAGNGKWLVSDRALQALNGVTRLIWLDLITGEERDKRPSAG